MNRWYPHLDYAGEPMREGEFRDPQPTNLMEAQKRNVAILTIEQFCEREGVAVPPLNEKFTTPNLVTFEGRIGDRVFGIGYEVGDG